jgi:hypothetical protein
MIFVDHNHRNATIRSVSLPSQCFASACQGKVRDLSRTTAACCLEMPCVESKGKRYTARRIKICGDEVKLRITRNHVSKLNGPRCDASRYLVSLLQPSSRAPSSDPVNRLGSLKFTTGSSLRSHAPLMSQWIARATNRYTRTSSTSLFISRRRYHETAPISVPQHGLKKTRKLETSELGLRSRLPPDSNSKPDPKEPPQISDQDWEIRTG